MSELTNAIEIGRVRWSLLSTVSALALIGASGAVGSAAAEDRGDHPTVWIELGAQVERVNGAEEQFAPPFLFATPRPAPETVSPLSVGHPPRQSIGGEGKISFEPNETDWVFSVSARYGRANASKHLRQQSYPIGPIIQQTPLGPALQYRRALQFMDTATRHSESHTLLDFQAGKDLGVGLFSSHSTSLFEFGVRYAQFGSRSNIGFKSDPDAHPTYKYFFNGVKTARGAIYHSNMANLVASRSFHGIGPSIAWSSSVPLGGDAEDSQIALDLGLNAAILFGRQKAKVHHQTTSLYHDGPYCAHCYRTTVYRNAPPDQLRSRSVTVPNVGGFGGVSFRYSNAKISLGYRADFFFGAMDGGIDTHTSENRSFYGPFATISVGLGG